MHEFIAGFFGPGFFLFISNILIGVVNMIGFY